MSGFVVAMRVVNAIAGDNALDRPDPPVEWLIVSRWGPRGECLTISDAVRGAPARSCPRDDHAPPDLAPRVTWFGEIAPAAEPPEPVFLLTRTLPQTVGVAGRFEAADGFARLGMRADGGLSLSVVARRPAAEAEDVRPGRIWHLAAERRPWIGECLEDTPDAPG